MSNSCECCGQKKSLLECVHCHCAVCKNCAQILDIDAFQFSSTVKIDDDKRVYCPRCFDAHIAESLSDYQDKFEKAKNIQIYYHHQSRETQFMSKSEKPISVDNCSDEKEALMKMAFQAVERGFNAIIHVQVKSKKVRTNNYQTQVVNGTGIPSNVTGKEIIKSRSFWTDPN